jgi:hypothetical protein
MQRSENPLTMVSNSDVLSGTAVPDMTSTPSSISASRLFTSSPGYSPSGMSLIFDWILSAAAADHHQGESAIHVVMLDDTASVTE